MTKGDAGQNISKFASSSTEASAISTSMPYISYVDLRDWLLSMYSHALSAIDAYFSSHPSVPLRSAVGFKAFTSSSTDYSDVFVCDGYRLCRAAKLLMSLGYGNFTTIIQYDIYSMAEKFVAESGSWSMSDFDQDDSYRLFAAADVKILNSPNLSNRKIRTIENRRRFKRSQRQSVLRLIKSFRIPRFRIILVKIRHRP